MFRFEKLEVWTQSVEYYDRVIKTSGRFPKDEVFGLTSQIRRSALSISLNIAEGSGRPTKKEFKQFLGFARGSLFETVSNLYVCRNRKLISSSEFSILYDESEKLSKMISSLRSTL